MRQLIIAIVATLILCNQHITHAVAQEKSKPILQKTTFLKLKNWQQHPHHHALGVLQQNCHAMQTKRIQWPKAKEIYPIDKQKWKQTWKIICNKAQKIQHKNHKIKAQNFFENNFIPFIINSKKTLFTGYYQPIYDGSRKKNATFKFPIYAKPNDLITLNAKQQHYIEKNYGIKTQFGRIKNGKPKPYFSRQQIDQGHLKPYNIEILWLKNPMDAFFLHIQGSGRINLTDGSQTALAFAAKNGHPYYAIGRSLIKNGAVKPENMSMQAIRQWGEKNPNKITPLLWENPSYIFFKEVKADKNTHPVGAQNIPLTPKISLAVDPKYHAYGIPIWVQTYVKNKNGEKTDFNQLMIAQDTGSAIKGAARADIFWGRGQEAEEKAGHMTETGTLFVLIPKNTLK